jgi:iron complex transport system substrate-binding protein
MGIEVTLPRSIKRIISAAPANTEIIIDLGLGEKLVAVDNYSLEVPGVDRTLPSVDLVYPDAEAIIAFKPDLIIASELNRIGGDDPFALIREAGIAVVYIPSGGGIAGIYRDVTFIAGILGVPERGETLLRTMKDQLDSIAAVGSALTGKKSVYFEISSAPNMVSFGQGTFLHELLELIGAENIFADTSGWIAPGAESIVLRNPDVILTNVPGTSGIPDPEGKSQIAEITGRPGFAHITAVRNRAIYWIDTDISSRPTHRIAGAVLQMARAVYPEYYK